jgi:sugar O-acyltransferase (sialic acid O-acetyltransferase NeuD family)
MNRKLVILGDSAFAEIAYELFTHDSDYEVVGFSVEREYLQRDELFGRPVVPFEEVTESFSPAEHDVYAAVVYGRLNRTRTRLADAAKERGYRLASYVSSKAFVWRNVSLAEHCFVFEHNVIQPFVTIGRNVVLWSGNHIGHHSRIGDNCFVSSHVVVSGFVDVGRNCFFGVNSTFANNLTIGDDVWVAPNAVITHDVEPGAFIKPDGSQGSRSTLEFFDIQP